MRNRKLGMAALGSMTLRSGDFMHWRENFKNNWQTSLPQPSCWHYSPPCTSFIISCLSLGIGLCSHDSRFFSSNYLNQRIFCLILKSLSQYICHQSAILLVLNVYRPNICLCLSPIISSLPFPKELSPSGILLSLTINSLGNSYDHLKNLLVPVCFLTAEQRRSPLFTCVSF